MNPNVSLGREILPTPAWAVSLGIYASGEVVGAQAGGLLVFPDAIMASEIGRRLVITKVLLTDVAKQNAPFDLFLFDANPSASTFTDNAAAAIHADDLEKHKATISIGASDYLVGLTANASKVAIEDLMNGLASVVMDSTTLYVAAVVRGTPTYLVSTNLKIALEVRDAREFLQAR
jgi:hypothetical protein